MRESAIAAATSSAVRSIAPSTASTPASFSTVRSLDGILYPQRIEDMRWFGFTQELVASGALPWAEQFETPLEELATGGE